jgi:geranylgeranyl diphosphate synthase type I
MAVSTGTMLQRHQQIIDSALRSIFNTFANQRGPALAQPYYSQMRYHLGWVNADFTPAQNNPGKLIRPTLLLLAYEAAGAWGLSHSDYLQRALPAAVAVELTHNFSLLHDDIEDGDLERRHRKTNWNLWGIPQSINTGDGMFALARLALWEGLEQGVEPEVAVQLAQCMDRDTITLSEGQFLDISFEGRLNISVAHYLDMISRKTAALMACAAELGARLGTRNQETINALRNFGAALGVVFQVRDDLLGVWATTAESGKTVAGDLYRRKKSLPILHALENATQDDREILEHIYQQTAEPGPRQIAQILAIFERTQTRDYCRAFLVEQCQLAYSALDQIPHQQGATATRALDDLHMLVQFLEEASG